MTEKGWKRKTMRRSDREVTDKKKIQTIIASCKICRVGFYDQGEIYIVPMNFGYREREGKNIFYFHGAKQGRKIDLISKSPMVGFEMDANYQLLTSETACGHSAQYQSVLGTGRMRLIESLEEKKEALQEIMIQSTGKDQWDFSLEILDNVAAFKLEVEQISCKEHDVSVRRN